jgi:hypothetical protein
MQLGRVKVRYERKSRYALHGRFGGGWQWKVGFQAGDLSRKHGTIIFSVLVFTVTVSWRRR